MLILTLTENFMSIKSNILAKFLSAFVILVGLRSAGFKHLAKYHLTQPACNIPEIFDECFFNVAMFRTSRDHLGNILKENIF